MRHPKLTGLLLGGSMLWLPLIPSFVMAAPRPHDGGIDVSPLTEPPAQLPRKLPEAPPRTTTAPDQATLQKLHDANQMEIQMGTIAKDKGSTKAVREFGRKLVADHTAADRRIEDYMRRHGGDLKTLATTTSADADHEMLATKSGPEFDRAFGLQMVADHTKAIEAIESARIETSDGQLRELYEVLLPTLQSHKRTAQDIVAASARS